MRYFLVTHKAGAFIDGVHYPPYSEETNNVAESLVELDLPETAKAPLWGQEVDRLGNPLKHGISFPREAVQDKMADELANKIAAGAGQAPVAPTPADVPVATPDEIKPAGLSDEQKALVKESLALLEHDNKTHWTARGLPNTETVSAIVGFTVERKDINEIAPDFAREIPPAKAAE
jgi:hypothetical protein